MNESMFPIVVDPTSLRFLPPEQTTIERLIVEGDSTKGVNMVIQNTTIV
jgi:hypothetical protein